MSLHFFSNATIDIGTDLGSTVADAYAERRPFRFDGKIKKMAVELK
jgi:arylsulfatase